MSVLKLLRSQNFQTTHKLIFTTHLKIADTLVSTNLYSSNKSIQLFDVFNVREYSSKSTRPLGLVFKEAVGLCEKSELDSEEVEISDEAKEIKKRLKDLENEIKVLNERKLGEREIEDEEMKKIKLGDGVLKNECDGKLSTLCSDDSGQNWSEKTVEIARVGDVSADDVMVEKLSALFSREPVKKKRNLGTRTREEEPVVCKELPPNMVVFARHLFERGYLKNANFLPKYSFDAACFQDNYSRAFLSCAAQNFVKDHREIAKWLSVSEVKKIVLFGCPSLSKKPIMSAKALRVFFNIPEDTVCSKCVLKESCKFVNQSIWKSNRNKSLFDLPALMRIITLYAMDDVDPQLVVPDDIKTAVTRLLEEVMKLSQNVSKETQYSVDLKCL